ncbi:MAG: Quinone oxidoreductase 1 [Alphaproteobacteria bacterium MarineAlpha5_Bin9]|nr:MAG: Quinone oxidoreductase 1 [Alphaproteobacteria bacterium MarineAlpha5_Bin9]|tara:strand:+ start:16084 stop:17109 length:1026 start_codon:yes stop_codon:yes gene_type:complete
MKNRIVRFSKFGGPEVLEIFNEKIKLPDKNEVRINIKALGLNQAEVMLREGRYVGTPILPSRIGIEGSGIIDEVGTNVHDWKVGDEVCAIPFLSCDHNDYWTSDSINKYGTYGDTAIVPAWTITKKIPHQTFEEAAAAWCQYLTAWGGLVYKSNIENSKWCVITGASSSAAIGAMQIVKIFGLKTIAISRTLKKEKALKEIGYDEVLSLDNSNLEKDIMDITNGIGFDLSYDCVGGEHFIKLINTVKPRGLIVNYGNLNLNSCPVHTLPLLAKRIEIRFHSIFDTMRFEDQRIKGVNWINDQMEKKNLRPIISKTFTLNNVVDSHKYLAEGNQLGKTVVTT